MLVDTRSLLREVLTAIDTMSRDELSASLVEGEYRITRDGARIHIGRNQCRLVEDGAEVRLASAEAIREIQERLEQRLRPDTTRPDDGSVDPGPFRLPTTDPCAVPGVVRTENTSQRELHALCEKLMKTTYSYDEVHGGAYCFVGEFIAAPYEMVFEYCADIRSLAEWTLSIRNLRHLGGGLYRGTDAISASDPTQPQTEIFIRADVMKGPEHGVIFYPCAWDQGDELWMRYYFLFTDAQKTIAKPGTIVLWTNCKHPYYDRDVTDVPPYIAEGRARDDRPWVGDLWELFYPLHRIELDNLKRLIEHRHAARSTRP